MYGLKQVPEDFVVEELIKPMLGEGAYDYFWLKKRGRTTLSAIKSVASALRLDVKNFGWAGNKDKQAITKQLVSIRGIDPGAVKRLSFKDIELGFVGRGSDPINLGNNIGNKFVIVVRNIDNYKQIKNISIINYFDEQRFSKYNVDIGRSIVKRDFKKAVELILKTKVDKEIKDHISKNKNDYVGALRKINRKLLLLYIHSYQSYLFNKTINNYIKNNYKKFKKAKYSLGEFLFPLQKIKNQKIPILGFGVHINNKFNKIINNIMKEEIITPRDFIIRELPNMSVEGDNRDLIINVKNLKISRLEKDEFNKGRKRVKVSFELPKGSYATLVIKALF